MRLGPHTLLSDESSFWLAPIIVQQIHVFIIKFAQRSQAAVIIAQQMTTLPLKVSDYG